MLSPQLRTFSITAQDRTKLQAKVLDALFRSVRELEPRHGATAPIPSLTVTEAKERLEIALPEYSKFVNEAFPMGQVGLGLSAREFGVRLHEWINEASTFFRQEGADCIRTGLELGSEEIFVNHAWAHLFSERLLDLARSEDMLTDEGALQTCDLVVESMKLWTRHVCSHLWECGIEDFHPSIFFLDTETDLQATITHNGRKLHLRGRPDAIFFDQKRSEFHLWEYKFGRQGQFELQVAQVILYMALIESYKGVSCASGNLTLFTIVEGSDSPIESDVRERKSTDPPFAPNVEQAFEGFIGNEAAVYRLKVILTLALKKTPPQTSLNAMFCGPGGAGKTELARRVAKALGIPLIDVPATVLGGPDDLVGRIDRVLLQNETAPEEDGLDSGLPLFRYPPVVVFIDEIHALARKSDAYLNLFEPNDRRAVCRHRIADLSKATFLTATTEKGKLATPFLSRFRILDLQPYSLEEVMGIAALEFNKADKPFSEPVLELLAKAGRLIPRTVIGRARDFLELHEFNGELYDLSVNGALEAMGTVLNIDRNGLTPNDHDYLEALLSGPRGISALTAILTCQREEIENVIEPYLVQLRAIRHTGRGREITEIGRAMLRPKNDATVQQ